MSVREIFDSGIWKGYPVMWGERDDDVVVDDDDDDDDEDDEARIVE